MLIFLIGLVAGWLITNIAQGAVQGRHYYRFEHGLYKDITETFTRCPHTLEATQKVNGVALAGCAHCTAVFVSVDDLRQVHYE